MTHEIARHGQSEISIYIKICYLHIHTPFLVLKYPSKTSLENLNLTETIMIEEKMRNARQVYNLTSNNPCLWKDIKRENIKDESFTCRLYAHLIRCHIDISIDGRLLLTRKEFWGCPWPTRIGLWIQMSHCITKACQRLVCWLTWERIREQIDDDVSVQNT